MSLCWAVSRQETPTHATLPHHYLCSPPNNTNLKQRPPRPPPSFSRIQAPMPSRATLHSAGDKRADPVQHIHCARHSANQSLGRPFRIREFCLPVRAVRISDNYQRTRCSYGRSLGYSGPAEEPKVPTLRNKYVMTMTWRARHRSPSYLFKRCEHTHVFLFSRQGRWDALRNLPI